MVEETREEGDVSGSIYLQYFTGGRNPLALLAIVVLSVTAEVRLLHSYSYLQSNATHQLV